MKKFLRYLLTLLILAILFWGGIWAYRQWFGQKTRTVFHTEEVERINLESTISATGTVEPEELVNVGAQVNGKIAVFGNDVKGNPVDYGSAVKQGMILARIDDAVYGAEMRSAEASMLQSEANIKQSKANIDLAKAQLQLARSNWKRAQELRAKDAMAISDYDNYKAEYDSAIATVEVREANLSQAEAEKASARASYDKAKQNFDYCTIASPVDGVIIDRRVSVGQTVVSSMSASSIFLIAKDLTKMQVWVSVNEADIGQIKPGMPVAFTVDAFPNESFVGKVHRIRLNATMSQNVVTYVVEVTTDNSSGRLLPYLTANVKFILAERKNVIAVPNAALRYIPEAALVAPEYRETAALAATVKRSSVERFVWVPDGDKIRPVKVKVGLNDGVSSEIVSGDLTANMQVVTGATQIAVADSGSGATPSGSPFLPKPPKRR
ncbi:MAG: efflux RND transporter periplasmic adaptor subunit [Victivallales bacterium]|jgi:HlyD family secretion protein|nr:efflux RND transporter periplasmic adaptor subunit [Victivallales bacterium]